MDIIKRSYQRKLANRQKEIKRLREELVKKEEELRAIAIRLESSTEQLKKNEEYIHRLEKGFLNFIESA